MFSIFEHSFSNLLTMDRWVGKVAVVTGASSGIGAAIVEELAKAGVITIGLARRKERIDKIIINLPEDAKKNLHAMKCDVSKESEIVNTFREIDNKFGGVDILVNNAGVVRQTRLTDADNSQAINEVVNTNLFGLIFATREAVQSMQKRKSAGHVVHINSVVGHKVPFFPGPFNYNVYPGTKYAVTAITETHRQEFIHLGTKIKVTSISPGMVDTEIVSDEVKQLKFAILNSEDIANAVLYVLGTPPHVQVHELTIKPVGEMF